jgi:hypothetical protein
MSIIIESWRKNIVCNARKCYSLCNENEQNFDKVSLINRMKYAGEKKANLTTNNKI